MKLLLTCIFISCYIVLGIIPCRSQSYVKVPYYMDMDISISLIDSLKEDGIADFIIYQTANKDSVSLRQNNNSSPILKMVTYVLWDEKNWTKTISIEDSCILQSCFNKSRVFSFRNFDRLWLREDENIYKVVPDYAEPYNKDIVIFITPNQYHFFEIGENTFYKLNKNRNKYREEFISLLRGLVIYSNTEWEKIADYNRNHHVDE